MTNNRSCLRNRIRRAHFPLFLPLILLLFGCSNPTPTTIAPTVPPPTPTTPPHLAVWKNTIAGGIPFTMVGTDPSIPGAGTTNVPVIIVPISLNFGGQALITPDSVPCDDSSSAISRVVNSPIFTLNDWPDGSINLGHTQFGDAFQRANFWSLVSDRSPDYHVMLQPISTLPTLNVDVPPVPGANFFPSFFCPSQPYGQVPIEIMDSVVSSLVVSQHITPDTLLILVTYDTVFLPPQGGVFVGYHSIQGNQTYIVSSYVDDGFSFTSGYAGTYDTAILSHEIGEWMDNPLGLNQVPAWGGFGIQQTCDDRLEVGDPLTGKAYVFSDPATRFPYHLQELAYFSWFSRNIPSLSIYQRYSTQGTFSTPAPPCP